MKQHYGVIWISILILIVSCDKADDEVRGCRNQNASNFDANATVDCDCCEFVEADAVFWIPSTSNATVCGPEVTIKLNNGQTATVSLISDTEPSSCDSTQDGYLRLNVGDYNYIISSNGCDPVTGTFKIVEGCNKIKIE